MAVNTLNKLLMQHAISAIFCHVFVEPTPSLALGNFQVPSNLAKSFYSISSSRGVSNQIIPQFCLIVNKNRFKISRAMILRKRILSVLVLFLLLMTAPGAEAQVGVGVDIPHASAMLDVTSANKGLLPPRLSFAQRQAVANPAAGLMVWCTDCANKTIVGQMQFYNGSSWTNFEGDAAWGTPQVSSLNCTPVIANSSGFISPQFTRPYSGTATFTYTDGNGLSYPPQTITSTGVAGLTATLAAGTLTTGNAPSTIVYTISGIPGGNAGTASFNMSFTGKSCSFSLPVATFNFSLGDEIPGGFKVFYILQPGDAGYDPNVSHGLAVAPSDLGLSSWAGAIAACNDLVLGGYDDWFLPNRIQLNWLYQAKVQGLVGGFGNIMYWSSTGNSNDVFFAWGQYFSDGGQNNDGKSYERSVRAVRAF